MTSQFDESLQDMSIGFSSSSSSICGFDMSIIEFPCGDDLDLLGMLIESSEGDLEDFFLSSKPQPIVEDVKRGTRVKFSTVEIRSYAIVIGDHDCDDGLPISLDWKYNPEPTIEVVEREDEVYSRHYPARRLSYFERTMRLSEVSGIQVGDRALLQERINVVALLSKMIFTSKSQLWQTHLMLEP